MPSAGPLSLLAGVFASVKFALVGIALLAVLLAGAWSLRRESRTGEPSRRRRDLRAAGWFYIKGAPTMPPNHQASSVTTPMIRAGSWNGPVVSP